MAAFDVEQIGPRAAPPSADPSPSTVPAEIAAPAPPPLAAHAVPNGRCKTCSHPERTRLELLIAGGASINAVARKFNLGRYALGRHWANHVSDERKAMLAFGPVDRQRLASRVAEESESILDHYKAVRSGLYDLYSAALEAGDRVTGAMVAGRLHENLAAIAKVTGAIASSPLVQHNTVNYFASDPKFAEFQSLLIAVLRPFPQARAAVIDAFERLESPALPLSRGVIVDAA